MDSVKLLSLLFYGFSSLLITIVNKMVLTTYGFPSYSLLGVGQMMFIILLLLFLQIIGKVRMLSLTFKTVRQIMPLPIFYMMNVFFGLGGTKGLSLPMFVVLRRFAILFTMILEMVILHEKPNSYIVLSVFVMIFGSMVAAMNDMGFNLITYMLIFLNNIATAGNNVLMKFKLKNKDVDKQSLVFYNCLFGVIPLLFYSLAFEDLQPVQEFSGWRDMTFVVYFLISCSSAYLLLISTALCVEVNSPLTTTIVGVTKNSLVTYVGMLVGGDYIFNWPNFVGLTVSLIGAILYSLVPKTAKKDEETSTAPKKVITEKDLSISTPAHQN